MPRAPGEALNTPIRSTGSILITLAHGGLAPGSHRCSSALRDPGAVGPQISRIRPQDDQEICRLALQVDLHSTVKGLPQLLGGTFTSPKPEYHLCGGSLLFQESQQVLQGT